MPTYTFFCACGWQDDLRTGFGTKAVSCPACAAEAARESVYRISFGGFASTPRDEMDYRKSFKDYTEAGAELEYQHSRMEEAAGKKLPTPPLARMAVANAQKLIKAGVQSSEDYKARLKH